jgi:aromatic-L-amino-acid decarboxylase
MADLADEFGLWLHVDAAYAGPAAAVPELRHHFAGWERAASITLNPHKWLFTPVDCSILYTARPEALRAAFSVTPDYLKTPEKGEARNLMDYGVALGRRFRSLKLWFVLRYFGPDGIRARIRDHCRMAGEFAVWVDAEPGWERIAPVPFSVVVFRAVHDALSGDSADDLNHRIKDRVNASGEAFLTHTVLEGRTVLRVAIGNLRTEDAHLARAWTLLQAARTGVLGELGLGDSVDPA